MITKKKIETINLFRDRNPKFVNKETLHSIELYNVKLNRKVSIPIISKQHSINGDIRIFLDASLVKNSNYDSIKEDVMELQIFDYLNNSNREDSIIASTLRNYVFINTEKIDDFQSILNHELQHSFDFYNNLIPPIPYLRENLKHCENEYRAFLASLAFSNECDVKDIYMEIRENALRFENILHNPFLKLFGFKNYYLNERTNPHMFAMLRVIKEIKEIKEYRSIACSWSTIFGDKIKPKEIIEKSKFLLNNEYRRLTGKSYDEMLDDLVNV